MPSFETTRPTHTETESNASDAIRAARTTPISVHIMENHDAALPLWRAAGRQRILVHVDPHHDAWFTGENVPPNAANFVGHALRERLIREWFWVVPDGSFATAENRALLLAALRKLMASYPGPRKSITIENETFRTSIVGAPLTICTLDGLPAFNEDVLLDLDVDFLTTPRVNYSRGNDPHPDLPWCWPGELLGRIARKNLRYDVVTIALSVEGGFTPLVWKHLGEELKLRLCADPVGAEYLRGAEKMRDAASARITGQLEDAEKLYDAATAEMAGSAAPKWNRAYLALDLGREVEARKFHDEALALDPSYGTAYHNEGLWHYAAGRVAESEREFHRALALDPKDAIAMLGLARLAMRREKWGEAEALLCRAIEIDAKLLDAQRALGKTLARKRRYREAAVVYETALLLARTGHPSVLGSSVISTEPTRWADRRYWRTLWNLAEVRERAGDLEQSAAAYRMAVAGGHDGVRMRGRLAWIAVRRGRLGEAWRETQGAASRIPKAMRDALVAQWTSVGRAWRSAADARRVR